MDTSLLIQLPGEIRNRIYELVLYHSDKITIRIMTGTPEVANTYAYNEPIKHFLGLLSTCKQIRYEASPVFYEMNTFALVSHYDGELQKHHNTERWRNGLRVWLNQIGERNRSYLSRVEIDVGKSYMYDHHPTSETVWRSVSRALGLFDTRRTTVEMKTAIRWTTRGPQSFSICIPLTDAVAAREEVDRAIVAERRILEGWLNHPGFGVREAGYRRMELETCGQELRNFISLIGLK